MGIEKKQFDAYMDNMSDMMKAFPDFMKHYVGLQGQRIVGKAKKRTPVDTGALRNAWKTSSVRMKGDVVEIDIKNGQDYATFIEYGTCRGIKPYFMVTVPIREVTATFPDDWKKEWLMFMASKGLK